MHTEISTSGLDVPECSRITIPLAVQGLGVVGGFGLGWDELRQTLAGAKPLEIPLLAHQGAHGPESLPVMRADVEALERFVSKRALRRIDRFSRLALLGACLALEDAGLSKTALAERTGVVVATGYGAAATTFAFLDSAIHDGDACSSPTHFSNSVHNAAAAHISILLKITGPCLTVTQFESSVASGLLTAGQWLAENRVDRILFGAVDEYCPVRGYCWSRFFGPGDGQPMLPLDVERQTAVMGEGAAFFVLARADGDSGTYGTITEVRMGNGEVELPVADLLILGADGHRGCGAPYQRVLERVPSAAAYSAAYGSLPTGQAFDLAVAGLTLRNGRTFPGPVMPCQQQGSQSLKKVSTISCLKFGPGGEYGAITVANTATL